MRRLLLLFWSFILVTTSFSQKEISDQEHAWLMYFGNHRITDRWGIHTEYQWRRADGFQHWQQSLLRLGLDYYAKSGAQFTAGYGWIHSSQYGDQPIAHSNNEHRIWEQAIVKSKIGRIDLQHRYRLEQRYIENWIKNSEGVFNQNGFFFLQRARYRLMLAIPITRKEMSDKTLFLAAYDEFFLGFGKGIAKNVLDQNRLYCALGWRFNAACNIQLGYLNQYVIKKDGIQTERNHTLQVSMTYNLDLRKNGE
ncbi:MAG: hypothetical protein RL040_405 [Bacteroidota bacterium]|jgi:hypothetical protein